MHPGNLFVDDKGDVVAVDLGIAGRLSKDERRFLAEILYGFIKRDYLKVAQVHFDAGYVPPHHDVTSFAQAIRAIGEPIHGQSAETISMAKLLTLLFEVLDPSFNMWKSAEPVVGSWIAKNLGPVGILEDTKEGLQAGMRLVHQMPKLAKRTEELSEHMQGMIKNGMKLDPEKPQKRSAKQKQKITAGDILRFGSLQACLHGISLVNSKLEDWLYL